MTPIRKSFQYGNQTVVLETAEIARQATSAIMVHMGEASVLVSSVVVKDADEGRDFFPLTINYQERAYAVGKIPGGFFRREGRPSEKETLTARLIDRPLRPLFPKGFFNEIQVVITVMSSDPDYDPDIASMIGASAALATTGAPFAGPIGAARVGYVDGEFILNPSFSTLANSDLDLVVSGTQDAVLMVESEANRLPEKTMLDAVVFGHEQQQIVINAINEFAMEVGATDMTWSAPETNETLFSAVADSFKSDIEAAYTIAEKMERYAKMDEIRQAAIEKLATQGESDEGFDEAEVVGAIATLEKNVVRSRVIEGQPRIDGRDNETVRPITVRTGVFPRTHGSALFTRGETQAIVVTTLGNKKDAQIIDALEGERFDRFMFHYNFPPYCVGETGMVGSPKRREIGHGKLAKRGVMAVVPQNEDYPYSLRVVSEITESNGSSSMASVCGASLAMMDAGVPLDAPVAGIAMGLVKEGEDYAVLSDILGDEDHLGDMDFKVAGTDDGVTALQMDIKITGITKEIMSKALEQAKAGRLHILSVMNEHLDAPREELSAYAPRMTKIKIPVKKIGEVIGKGGATIKALTEETNSTIEINDDGQVTISTTSQTDTDAAIAKIEALTADVEEGAIYEGKVVSIRDFGAFVNILPGKDGLLHISQISDERIENVEDELEEGQIVRVKVLEVDKQNRLRLSMKPSVFED